MTENALVTLENKTPAEIFADGGIDPIIKKITEQAEADAQGLDISTEPGRKAIASLAYDVAKAKNLIDKTGKELKSEWKARCDKIDGERNRAWEALEALQHKIRKPLTDWENSEKNRVATLEARLQKMSEGDIFGNPNPSIEEIDARVQEVNALFQYDWEEFLHRATFEFDRVSKNIRDRREHRKKADDDAAELKRLQDAEAARLQKEREDKIAKDAEEKATREANEKAEQERQRVAAENLINLAWEEAHRDNAEFDRQAAEKRERMALEQAENAKWIAIFSEAESDNRAWDQRVADEKREAERKEFDAFMVIYNDAVADNAAFDATARASKEAADRQAAEKREADAREADKAHKGKINREARDAIRAQIKPGDDEETAAQVIVEAIARGQIPHVKISY